MLAVSSHANTLLTKASLGPILPLRLEFRMRRMMSIFIRLSQLPFFQHRFHYSFTCSVHLALLVSLSLCSFFSFLQFQAHARPEYAVRYGFTRCTSCHISPTGGGPRNIVGKSFGFRGYAPGPFASQELFSLDLRFVHYHNPDSPNTARGGTGIMATNLSANIPLTSEEEEGTKKMRLVFSHNLAGFPSGAGSTREVFLRWQLKADASDGISPQYVLLGRFVPPFGILTDEHRTYTKMQTQNTWLDLDMGLLLSSNPTNYLHYDFALVNGQKKAGVSPAAGNAATWGGLINLRILNPVFPLGFGLSGLHYERVKEEDSPSAAVFYLSLNLQSLTHDLWRAVLLTEYVIAQGFNSNPHLSSPKFFSSQAYADTVKDSESRGIYTLLDWQYSDHLSYIYKFDHYTPDRAFPGDTFVRHGIGIKYYFGANFFTQIRLERALAGAPSEKNGEGMGAANAVWAYLQISI